MTTRYRIGLIVGAAALAVVATTAVRVLLPSVGGFDPANPATTLADVERTVSRRFPVAEVTGSELADAVGGAGNGTTGDNGTVLFDVREADEFATSHIPGAVRVDPGLSAAEFAARHGQAVSGKRVVFYCAVGVRSGMMAQRTDAVLKAAGAAGVYNLRGGIFRWHAGGGTLAAGQTAGRAPGRLGVHPYDAQWGQLLNRTLAEPSRGPSSGPDQGALRP